MSPFSFPFAAGGRKEGAFVSLDEAAGGLGADGAAEGEGGGDVVAESVAGVGAVFGAFVDFGGGAADGVESPGDLLQIFDEFVTTRVDEEVRLVGGAHEAAVDAVDAVAHGGVGITSADGGVV